MRKPGSFAYQPAFSRNLGLVSEAEQVRLRDTTVAIPGLGGVGGGHAVALARLGVGAFRLADPDIFELVNFNRQLGATMDTVGRPKTEAVAAMVRAVNPEARVTTHIDGISAGNIGRFLDGVQVVMDGLEFFAIETRRMLYVACRKRGIPVVHAGPIGYGATLIVFMPEGPSFDAHFGIEDDMTRAEMLAAHALGHARGARTEVDPSRVDFESHTGPALVSACLLCSALAATEALKLVTGRGRVASAPHGLHIDPFRSRSVRLRSCPSLTRSWRGRLLRRMVFRRYPALEQMHFREKRERAAAPADPGDEARRPTPRNGALAVANSRRSP